MLGRTDSNKHENAGDLDHGGLGNADRGTHEILHRQLGTADSNWHESADTLSHGQLENAEMNRQERAGVVDHTGRGKADSEMQDSAGTLSHAAVITHLQANQWMRLTITKDFSKKRKQSPAGKGLKLDELPAQRRFSCAVCGQAFVRASACLSHISTHTDVDMPDLAQGTGHGSGLIGSGGSVPCEEDREVSGGCERVDRPPACADEVDTKEDNDGCKVVRSAGGHPHTLSGSASPSHGTDTELKKHTQHLHASDAITKKGFKQHHFPKDQICQPVRWDKKRSHAQKSAQYGDSKSSTLGSRKKKLQLHKQQDLGISSVQCLLCNASFATENSSSLPRCQTPGSHLFKCSVNDCGKSFPSVASLRRHARLHSQERPHVCQHCGKAFKMLSHLREHVRIHTGEKPFVCEVCGAGFAQSNGLKSHAKQHSVQRENQCDICHKAFSNPANLQLHKKLHNGEKPFSCLQCGQAFLSAANLGAHKKLKHEVKDISESARFICDICGAAFSQACNLGIHRKKKHSDKASVSGERCFVCDICDARFSEACNLGAHKKLKHREKSEEGQNIFQCDICQAKFYRACNLSGHKKRKHGVT